METKEFIVGQKFDYTDTAGITHNWEVTLICNEGQMCRAKTIDANRTTIESGFIIQDGKILN